MNRQEPIEKTLNKAVKTIECVVLALFGKEHAKIQSLDAATLSQTIARLRDKAGLREDLAMVGLVGKQTKPNSEDPAVKKYIESPSLEFPIQHPNNPDIIRITQLEVACKRCGGKTKDVHGKPEFHSGCIELEAAGCCDVCKMVTWTKNRFYADHMLTWGDTGITELPMGKPERTVNGRLFTISTRWIGYSLLVMAGNTLAHGLGSGTSTFLFVCTCIYLANLLIGMTWKR